MSGHLADAIEWFVQHEADRRGVDGSPYEVMKRKFSLSFDEACTVCREVRKLVGPYPSTPGGYRHPNQQSAPDRSGRFLCINDHNFCSRTEI